MGSKITDWAIEDRPREKLLIQGKTSLTDAELIAVLLGSGSRGESAIALAQKILKEADYNLHDLARWDCLKLSKFKGVGTAKSVRILSALELGLRRNRDAYVPKQQNIKTSAEASHWLYPKLSDLNHEEFWVLVLNRANVVIGMHCVSKGGLTGTLADGRIIFRIAIENRASGVILAHNHPSGNLRPSEADKQLTNKLINASKVMDVQILDHLIIAGNQYFSFADEGLI
jgi:DNA repair protein RadC